MKERVVVRVPATVANVGPGFDAVGFALAWHNEIRVEQSDEGVVVTATGPGSERIKKDSRNMVVRAIARLLERDVAVRVNEMIAIASGRGFGSSAAAICAGLLGARALFETSHTDDDILAIATEMEGHADNVAPCLLGGITIVGGASVLRVDPPSAIMPLVCVAPNRQSTEVARAALSPNVSREDAVFNIGRAAMLGAALAAGDAEALLEATDDRIHQPTRFELMPDSGDLVHALRARGLAAFLSGAGPSVAALVTKDQVDTGRAAAPEGWEIRLEKFDARGAEVVDKR